MIVVRSPRSWELCSTVTADTESVDTGLALLGEMPGGEPANSVTHFCPLVNVKPYIVCVSDERRLI